MLAQCIQLWRRLARVGHCDLRAGARAPARHRQPGRAEAEDEDGPVFQKFHGYLSFKVDKPSRHKSMVMIQKRTTT